MGIMRAETQVVSWVGDERRLILLLVTPGIRTETGLRGYRGKGKRLQQAKDWYSGSVFCSGIFFSLEEGERESRILVAYIHQNPVT